MVACLVGGARPYAGAEKQQRECSFGAGGRSGYHTSSGGNNERGTIKNLEAQAGG